MVRTFFYLTKTYMNMENLKIRITLTNTKGWKETQVVSYERYLSEKENGENVVDKVIQRMTEDYENMKQNTINNNKDIKWRP